MVGTGVEIVSRRVKGYASMEGGVGEKFVVRGFVCSCSQMGNYLIWLR